MSAPTITIHYRRPPDRVQLFRQHLVHEDPEVLVTLLESAELPGPMIVDGRTVLEPGSPVVWFTFPGRWYDIGRFHRADGTFSGYYANILTPVEIAGRDWSTTDLFLDVWSGADGRIELLDEEELASAVSRGEVGEEIAARALATANDLLRKARQGEWPPPIVGAWTLERARAVVGE